MALDSMGDAQIAAIKSLQSAEELHQFALNHNINDGVAPVFAVLANPYCDAGTALYEYWLCWPGFDGLEPRADRADLSPDLDALRAEIIRRLESRTFSSALIRFDPREGLSKVQQYRLEKEGERLLNSIGSAEIARIWL
jgi:hypothetical protein